MSFLDELATTSTGDLAAYSPGGRGRVQVWNLSQRECENEFDTVLQPGGYRLAVSDSGIVVAAAFSRAKVAAYSGCVDLWVRHDIRRTQHIRFGQHGSRLWMSLETGAAHVLDPASGLTLDRVSRVSSAFPDPTGEATLLYWKRSVRLRVASHEAWQISCPTSPLDVLFCASHIAIVASGLLIVDRESGTTLLQVPLPENAHWTYVAQTPDDREHLYLVRYPHLGHGRMSLDRMEHSTGEVVRLCELSSVHYRRCMGGRRLLGTGGDLRRLPDGDVVATLPWAGVTPR